jgi:hypothetical protein
MPCAIFSVSLVALGGVYIVAEQVGNVIITGAHLMGNTMSALDGLVPTCISLGVLALFLLVMFIYPIFEIRHNKRKISMLVDTTIE